MTHSVAQVQLSSACLKGCHLDVDGLIRLGMTQDTMALFRFSLDEWIGLLKLRKEHLRGMSEAQVDWTFGLTMNVVEAAIMRESKAMAW